MNAFVSAIANQSARTENGMLARKSTASACVDLFYSIGASRGKDIIPKFVAAYVHDADLALRIALWGRDVRGGAGERKVYRDIMKYLESVGYWTPLYALMDKTAEIGRWDDLLVFISDKAKNHAHVLIAEALRKGNGLCAKWMPRKGPIAAELRNYMGMSPRTYRKTLVELTRVVETQMCANDWDGIDFSAVPSVAHTKYGKAFKRHTPNYGEYVAKLHSGDKSVKVNVGAVYPHNVIAKFLTQSYNPIRMTDTELDFVIQQWNALENYMTDANVLPMVDSSGSMYTPASPSPIQVAVSLGLYMADKNKGPFKDTFLTFSADPQLLTLRGNILEKVKQIVNSQWGMNTNLIKAIEKILKTAVDGKVSQEDMPKMLVVLSDMQFDRCAVFDDSAMQSIQRQYENAGYEVPLIVFWNLNDYSNTPAKYDERGVALISGFSPAIMKAVLSCDVEAFTPIGIMMKTVMVERYNLG